MRGSRARRGSTSLPQPQTFSGCGVARAALGPVAGGEVGDIPKGAAERGGGWGQPNLLADRNAFGRGLPSTCDRGWRPEWTRAPEMVSLNQVNAHPE